MATTMQKVYLYEFIDNLVKLEALDLAPAAPIPRNEARSAPMKVTASQAARDCRKALLQLKKDNVPMFVVEWCAFEGSPDVLSLGADHSVSLSDVAGRVLGGVALTCWGHGQKPEDYARTRPLTCVADTYSREHGAGTLSVSAIEGAQMAVTRHSHNVFIDCRGDTTKGRRGQSGTYSLLRDQSYFNIIMNRLAKIGRRGEFLYSEEFEETVAPAVAAIRGEKALSHCISGASRSIALVAGVLVGAAGLEPRDAFAYLAQIRGIVELGAMSESHAHALPTLEHYKHRWRQLCGDMGLTATIRRVVDPEDAKDLFLDALARALAATINSDVVNVSLSSDEEASEEEPSEEKPASRSPSGFGDLDAMGRRPPPVPPHDVVVHRRVPDPRRGDGERFDDDAAEHDVDFRSGPLAQNRNDPGDLAARGGPCHAATSAHDALVAAQEDGGVVMEKKAPAPRSHKRQTSDDQNAVAAEWHERRRIQADRWLRASRCRPQGVGLGQAGWHASGVEEHASSSWTQGQGSSWSWPPWQEIAATECGVVAGSPSSVVDAQAVEIRDDTEKAPIVEWTALHQAYNTYDEESVRRLLFMPRAANYASAVAPSGNSCEGSLPLHIAAFRHRSRHASDASLLERLVTLTPCLDAPNKKGQTPLHIACAQGHVDLVRILLDGRADPNIVCEDSKGDFISIEDVAKKSLSWRFLLPLLQKVRDRR